MRTLTSILLLIALGIGTAPAQQSSPSSGAIDAGRVDGAVKSAFPGAPADWQSRLIPDETMRQCSAYHNHPPRTVADAIQQRERATIVYSSDNTLSGDWKKGEAIAQSGYGLRFTDYPPRTTNGGNCYACHQLTRREVSYGTLGPSLLQYGKLRNFGDRETRATYDKVYNSQAALACSSMPRFGSNGILTLEQIKDLVALLMSPDSPVNK